VLPGRVLRYWMLRLPHVAFTNLYGPTETTIASSYYTVPAPPRDETSLLPIGEACPGEELLILDDRLHDVEDGEQGEICIRGAGLSLGYWRNPSATESAFVPNPYSGDSSDRLYRTGDLGYLGRDGLLYYVGRRDSQIKSRGHRVELGEIETALQSLSCLQDSAVVAMPTGGFEGTIVCCAYVAAPGPEVTPAALRRLLGEMLPPYMLPSLWKAVPRLPLTPSGKVDRNQILRSFTPHPAVAS